MAGQIKVTPEELRTQAKAYTNGAQSVNDVLSSLDNANGQMEGIWSGAAFEKYMDQYNQLKPKVQQFMQLLDDINGQLNNAAQTLEDTDQHLSQGFGF